jgi:cytidyltransferase-like protein
MCLDLVAHLHARGQTVVFIDGAFDLLRAVHVQQLERARSRGDALIVGVHSDAIVRATAGTARPITPEAERAEIVAALACVDAVLLLDRSSIMAELGPDISIGTVDAAEDTIIESIRARARR